METILKQFSILKINPNNMKVLLAKFIRFLFPHVHYHYKIIASRYTSFNWRDIVIECRCGHRCIEHVHHDSVFPFPTTCFITNKEMQDLVDHKDINNVSWHGHNGTLDKLITQVHRSSK